MAVRFNPIRDSLLFYELMEESENVSELNKTIENLVDAFRCGICDLCDDNGWDYFDVDSVIM